MLPVLPAVAEAPVLNIMVPLTPEVPAFDVERTMAPLLVAVPDPDVIVIEPPVRLAEPPDATTTFPPTAFVPDEEPAKSETVPTELTLVPLPIKTEPLPAGVGLEPMYTAPLTPAVEMPVLMLMVPVLPTVPDAAVCNKISPLVAYAPEPLVITTFPPVAAELDVTLPPERYMAPPGPTVLVPTERVIVPPTPPLLYPLATMTDPLLPAVPEPDMTLIGPADALLPVVKDKEPLELVPEPVANVRVPPCEEGALDDPDDNDMVPPVPDEPAPTDI